MDSDKPFVTQDVVGTQFNLLVTDQHNERGQQLGYLTCPSCGAKQQCIVKKQEGDKAITVMEDIPPACEHFSKVESLNVTVKPVSNLLHTCQTCGQPNAHNLSVHGMLCNDCSEKMEPVCDFCTAPNPPWVYPTQDFRMPLFGLSGKSTKGWAACDECKTLIDLDKKKELSKRACDSYLQHNPKDRESEDVQRVAAAMKAMHVKFHANRYGPAIPVAEADKLMPPPPKRIAEGTAQYMAAIEKRLEWAQWAELRGPMAWREYGAEKLVPFKYTLDHGETYYMDQHFCELVDGARQSIPGEMEFHRDWVVSPFGWMWLAKPFVVPDLEDQKSLEDNKNPLKNSTMTVSAIGWRKLDEDRLVMKPHTGVKYVAGPDRYWLCCFVDHNRIFEKDDPWKDDPTIPKQGERPGFGAWSFFTLAHGDKLSCRIEEFEGDQRPRWRGGDSGYYTKNPDRKYDLLHEMRWIFTAFYMMSQRLATRTRHQTSRMTKRRLERVHRNPPPWIEIVTLRRKQQARDEESKKGALPVDWQWRWTVNGFWRQQWYPNEGMHKPKFIDTYWKGPADKPIKPPSSKIFVAER